MNTFSLMLDRKFKLTQHDTTIKKEFTAGTLIYFGMAYILAVNPNILSAAGMDSTAVMLATCLASAVGTFCMGMMANLPFAMSAGMGLNAFFAYTVVIGMGYPWEKALLAVFVEGIICHPVALWSSRSNLQCYSAQPQSCRFIGNWAVYCLYRFPKCPYCRS